MRILITGCNRMRKSTVDSLKNNRDGRDVYVVGIDSSKKKILRTGVDRYYVAPMVEYSGYVDWLTELCESERIDIVIPFLQRELELAAEYKDRLAAAGTKVSIASKETLAVVNSKIALHDHYPEYMPRQAVCRSEDDLRRFRESVGMSTPICCKVDGSWGGSGFSVVSYEVGPGRMWMLQLRQLLARGDSEIIVQEFIEGIDYNTVALADRGKLVGVCGFSGGDFELGAYTYGEMLKVQEAYDITERIVRETGLDGNACFDFILKPDGTPVLLECNPRVSSGLAFPCAAGADFLYQRCKMLLGEKYATEYRIDYDLKMTLCHEYSFYK